MSAVSAAETYARALSAPEPLVRVRRADGRTRPLPLPTWLGPVSSVDLRVLARARAPVLDVGCGPGRHVLALARRGVLALGLDVEPAAVRLARGRGAPVVEGDVFARVRGAGTWGTALLLDGNVGIGGDPPALLARLAALLRPGGDVLAELDEESRVERLRLEAPGAISEWFAWARLGRDGLPAAAAEAGLTVDDVWEDEGRRFARLTTP